MSELPPPSKTYSAEEILKRTVGIVERDILLMADPNDHQQAPFVRVVHENKHTTAFAKSTAEVSKRRRRCLMWTKRFNEDFIYTADCQLQSPEEVIAQILKNEDISEMSDEWESVCFDIRSAYYQHEIDPAFAEWCIFTVQGKLYMFVVLPMGATVSPEIMQRMANFLGRLAIKTAPLVLLVVHIDNFRFFGPKSQVRMVAEEFKKVCMRYNVTLNPEEWGNGDFLGMNFQYTKPRSVGLAKKFILKLHAVMHSLNTESTVGIEVFASIFGKLFFAAAVLDLDLCYYYYAIKQYRIMSRKMAKGIPLSNGVSTTGTGILVHWWTDALDHAKSWCEKALDPALRRMAGATCTGQPTLFCDASDIGFGLVLINGGTVYASGEKWKESRFRNWADPRWLADINQRETLAVEAGAEWIQILGFHPTTTHLRVDNMTARAAERKRWHANFFINESLCRTKHRWRSTEYVNTKHNYADYGSRHPDQFYSVDDFKQFI